MQTKYYPEGKSSPSISLVIPTYNESENIRNLLYNIDKDIPKDIQSEAIVVDDNSPDGTATVAQDYVNSMGDNSLQCQVIQRKGKEGLSSAIMDGIRHSKGDYVVVMDADLSHPPKLIPSMIDKLTHSECDLILASRYSKGGSIEGWSLKRKVISKGATFIARRGLGIKESDPMSGFFAFKRKILDGINFDAIGYKMLMEILVKKKGIKIQELPYTFTNRTKGKSKIGVGTIFEFVRSVWKLYLYGRRVKAQEKRTSVHFLSKAARFYTVGASGVAVNYIVSYMFGAAFPGFWYVFANMAGIVSSMSTNFVLNKMWTFEDADFALRHTISQYIRFVGFSSGGALIQIGMVYALIEHYSFQYPLALILAVLTAAFGNFVLNKKWTFKEKVWE